MPDQQYWDRALNSFLRQPGRLLWRECRDSIYEGLLENWLGKEMLWDIALKTDLFDEAVSEGLLPYLSRLAKDVQGVDVSPEVVAAAQSRHPNLKAKLGDARTLPYDDDSVGLVLSNSTLDHFSAVSDLELALQELHRILKPGGRLVVTLDNPENPLIAARKRIPYSLLKRLGLVPFFPGVTLSGKQLRDTLVSAGFAVESQCTLLHVPRVFAVKLAALVDYGPAWIKALYKKIVTGLECFEGWPGSRFSGHYVAALAVKPVHSQ